jgi:hypothetical protein
MRAKKLRIRVVLASLVLLVLPFALVGRAANAQGTCSVYGGSGANLGVAWDGGVGVFWTENSGGQIYIETYPPGACTSVTATSDSPWLSMTFLNKVPNPGYVDFWYFTWDLQPNPTTFGRTATVTFTPQPPLAAAAYGLLLFPNGLSRIVNTQSRYRIPTFPPLVELRPSMSR